MVHHPAESAEALPSLAASSDVSSTAPVEKEKDHTAADDTLSRRPTETLSQRNTSSNNEPRAAPPISNPNRDLEKQNTAASSIRRKRTRGEQFPDPEDESKPKDPNLVDWDGPDDPGNPQNWPAAKRWAITCMLGLTTFVITFASSVFSSATEATAMQFGVSMEVMTLGTSLFVLGFAFGPIIWGPLSELYGRKYPLYFGIFVFAIFQIPVAVAQNLQTIFICRFFGGLFGSAPLAIIGGTLADMFPPVERGIAICIFAGATFIGPVAGPIVGGFVTMSHLGWRWTEYITAIMGFFFGALGFVLVPETYAAVILQQRAKKRRFETRNWALHAKLDESPVNPKEIVQKYLLRPFAMLIMEPILFLVTLYMAFVYGILYLLFSAYPIAFQEQRGWNLGVGALPFLSITVGVIIGSLIITYITKTRFARKLEENNGQVVPEERLIPMMIGGAFFPAGLFWFAWTSNPNILWVPQVMSGALIGAGILMIFMQGLNYIIDCYVVNANSAIAANTFLRSFFGAGFPLFATAMYHTLGVDWATSLLGFLAVALFPVPILFYVYGARIRQTSSYSPT
ncbi:MFS general substrate transporter [Pseudovirgaria hyperparasitica]|uniref:MFS general substrate transporter n=1 Tax=Pseudovirgaria hyperparasitica TaxID=470096 RepID=A0A6A6WM82_9PEZI|nr:MFS general substrate transporter [Pseudovirgaria hyperparasitica]KAF2763320.1 MFS general substrate transporter [Pseudovirgaria hyperparasitica]